MADLNQEHQLLLRIAKGDSRAFSSLLAIYKSKVYGTCFYLMGDRALAEDLSQETWIRVVQNAESYRPIASVSSWILRIARNACLNELRTRHRWAELSVEDEGRLEDGAESVEEVLQRFEKEEKFQKALLELTAQQKMALLMVVQEEKSHSEVAQELQCSVGAVKVLLFRARETLKKHLEES